MKAFKSFFKCFTRKKESISNVILGTITITLIRMVKNKQIRVEYSGHKSILTPTLPRSTFDVFKHGTALIRIGSRRTKIKTEKIGNGMTIEENGTEIKIEYSASKKKLTPEDFLFLSLIGRGAFGRVILVKHKTTARLYACKIIRKTKSQETLDKMINERNILTQVHSPFLIHLLAAFQTEDKVYLILPYIEGGELFNLLEEKKTFSEEEARFYLSELLLAVEYLHSNKIIYRDIKPENILLDRDGHIVLCDFGMSIQNTMASSYCGTPEYIAPEIIKNESYNESVDYYTLGVLLFEMVTGQPPFTMQEGDDLDDLENKILFTQPEFPSKLSPAIVSLLKDLLQKTPSKRPNIQSIKNHPFFNGIEWERVERKEYYPRTLPSLPGPDMQDTPETLDTPNDSYQGFLPGFTYCAEEWTEEDHREG
ncbi:serum/glucocorticoid-regulated kinase 2 [Nematocida sp. AWRm80]|nr:serum/glucocorticoid-regulated kinase 2 [Nematocida sp. AWRm80]